MLVNGQEIDPAVIQALLEAANDEGAQEGVNEQMALANTLRGRAMGNSARTGYGVVAQGLQGALGGMEAQKAREARGALGQKQAARRGKFFETLFPKTPAAPGYMGEVPGPDATWGYGD